MFKVKKRNGRGLAESDFEKAGEFNGQFTDVFTKTEHSQVPLLNRKAPFMEDIVVSKEGVTKLLKGLNPSKALGPDELHPRVLKELASELGPVFAHLFQQSIDSGEIPKEWSLANICPLFKKADRSLACNYRPVSLTCVPCKLLEHIVCRNQHSEHYLTHSGTATRGHGIRFLVPYCSVNAYKNSFFPSTVRLWNSLPVSAVTAPTLDAFKSCVGAGPVLY